MIVWEWRKKRIFSFPHADQQHKIVTPRYIQAKNEWREEEMCIAWRDQEVV